mmetsp:Transcript_22973/g.78226  ORF Transcript_22973/g.78226 Transcript_22973/m.78226 type:complete len:845 (+) Transcript_22973:83-2617(+)
MFDFDELDDEEVRPAAEVPVAPRCAAATTLLARGGGSDLEAAEAQVPVAPQCSATAALPARGAGSDPETAETQVSPLTPFKCRLVGPATGAAVRRVLVLLHGWRVSGDDLESEAEALRILLPDTVVVLPEAPVLLDTEHGLRSWWTPRDATPETAEDIRALRREGLLRAPEDTRQRLVATVGWVLRKFDGAPLFLGGFSQGSQLVAQSLADLSRAQLLPRGVVVLSGLVEAFKLPVGVRCLVLHGGQDSRVPVDIAKEVAAEMNSQSMKFEVLPRLGHEVSDQELDMIAAFCNEHAPLSRGGGSDASAHISDEERVRAAKLARYVKRMSEGLSVYDKDWYMKHLCDLDMRGLGDDCQTLPGGLRYCIHKAAGSARGTVLLFHGKVRDVRAETSSLAAAYARALALDVAVVDYRQSASCFGLDAQTCLECLEQLTGSATGLVIIHGTGLGSACAIHMAMSAQVMPAAVDRRLRLLVLDGAFGALHMNVGCTTKDPIANDSKLAYVRMPVCLVGGDDPLFGVTTNGETQWSALSDLCEEMLKDKRIPSLAQISETALLRSSSEGASLNPELAAAVRVALDRLPAAAERGQERGKDFMTDVLDVSEEFSQERPPELEGVEPWRPPKGGRAKVQLEAICEVLLKVAASAQHATTLTEAKATAGAGRLEVLVKLWLGSLSPTLVAHGFQAGAIGLLQFESAMASTSEFFADLKALHGRISDAFNLQELPAAAKSGVLHSAAAGASPTNSATKSGAGGGVAGGAGGKVSVVVEHLTKGGSINIFVDSAESTILDVRKAIMQKLEEASINKVKIVIQEGRRTKMIPDGEALGARVDKEGRAELLMVGRALQ